MLKIKLSANDLINTYFGLLCILIVSFAIAGGIIHYSPVPYWDMWDDYYPAIDGDLSFWWSQHNEHRLLLTRFLCWVDIKCFGGLSIFLDVSSYVLACVSTTILVKCLYEITSDMKELKGRLAFAFFVVGWMFLWVQAENFTFGYNVQFFFAYLLPLGALYFMHKSTKAIHGTKPYFLIACVFGALSFGAMANGILTLPLLVLYAILFRQSLLRICILITLSLGMLWLFLYDYSSGSASLSAILSNPFGYMHFVFSYLGEPLAWGVHRIFSSKQLLISLGILFVASFIFKVGCAFLRKNKSTLEASLLMFMFYVIVSAMLTGIGRMSFGVVPRYSTGSIMGWAALFVLLAPYVLLKIQRKGLRYLIPLGVLFFLMFWHQCHALKNKQGRIFERNLAGLALELQIRDESTISRIYPDLTWVLSVAKRRSDEKVSIFNAYPWVDDRKNLGKTLGYTVLDICEGSLENVMAISGESQFLKISGWLYHAENENQPELIHILNDQHKIVGYGLVGEPRKDVQKKIGQKAQYAGFQGYVLSGYQGQRVMLLGDHESCQLPITI